MNSNFRTPLLGVQSGDGNTSNSISANQNVVVANGSPAQVSNNRLNGSPAQVSSLGGQTASLSGGAIKQQTFEAFKPPPFMPVQVPQLFQGPKAKSSATQPTKSSGVLPCVLPTKPSTVQAPKLATATLGGVGGASLGGTPRGKKSTIAGGTGIAAGGQTTTDGASAELGPSLSAKGRKASTESMPQRPQTSKNGITQKPQKLQNSCVGARVSARSNYISPADFRSKSPAAFPRMISPQHIAGVCLGGNMPGISSKILPFEGPSNPDGNPEDEGNSVGGKPSPKNNILTEVKQDSGTTEIPIPTTHSTQTLVPNYSSVKQFNSPNVIRTVSPIDYTTAVRYADYRPDRSRSPGVLNVRTSSQSPIMNPSLNVRVVSRSPVGSLRVVNSPGGTNNRNGNSPGGTNNRIGNSPSSIGNENGQKNTNGKPPLPRPFRGVVNMNTNSMPPGSDSNSPEKDSTRTGTKDKNYPAGSASSPGLLIPINSCVHSPVERNSRGGSHLASNAHSSLAGSYTSSRRDSLSNSRRGELRSKRHSRKKNYLASKMMSGKGDYFVLSNTSNGGIVNLDNPVGNNTGNSSLVQSKGGSKTLSNNNNGTPGYQPFLQTFNTRTTMQYSQANSKEAESDSGFIPLLSEEEISAEEERVIRITLFFNCMLAFTKTITFLLSLSMSILASLVDSIVDLGVQGVLYYSNTVANKKRCARVDDIEKANDADTNDQKVAIQVNSSLENMTGNVVGNGASHLTNGTSYSASCNGHSLMPNDQRANESLNDQMETINEESGLNNNLSGSGNGDPDYPAGRSRIEPVGVVIAASVMSMASIEVVRESIEQLYELQPSVDMTLFANLMLVGICLVKFVLYKYSERVSEKSGSSAVAAIAMDNYNDCMSNFFAWIFANLASSGSTLICSSSTSCNSLPFWAIDPTGAILISIYIIYSWVSLGIEQVEMLVGKVADTEFLKEVQLLAETHAPERGMLLDKLNAYHFGSKFLVELEMVMPEDTRLRESHDAGVSLQHAVELLPEVERCFVHIDYSKRTVDDHNPHAPLYLKTYVGSPAFTDKLVEKVTHVRSKEENSY